MLISLKKRLMTFCFGLGKLALCHPGPQEPEGPRAQRLRHPGRRALYQKFFRGQLAKWSVDNDTGLAFSLPG